VQIRRKYLESGHIQLEKLDGSTTEWHVADAASTLGYSSPFTEEWEVGRAKQLGLHDGDIVLPFQPLSFRDFMIFEQHAINAARGYARHFHPVAERFVRIGEMITRRPFRSYVPSKLWYKEPIYYMSNALTYVPSGTPISFPSYSQALDYELELGFVLKSPLYNASAEAAEQAIGAFVVICDFSARDVQIPEMRSGFGPQKSKHFISSLSSTAVTPESILADWRKLRASVTINGTVIAQPEALSARYSLGEMLARASTGEQLHPGELFGTGSFVGGCGMEINRWLQPGDHLELEIEGVGKLEHLIH
jgi:2-keto-4-pentenoate hydratase/2-oxohepta-3-ene-1,7-dioic acid hydratase in catechol pathway